jgi:RecJ-like exonuclease
MTTITCESCSGSGTVVETRSRWIGGTKTGYGSTWTGEVRCDECRGAGTIPAVACEACEALVAAGEAITTVDGEGHICLDCYEAEQAAILAGAPELAFFAPWVPGPEVA